MKEKSFWDNVKPGDPVMDEHGAVIDTENAPEDCILVLVEKPQDPRHKSRQYAYYYDPHQEMEGVHVKKARDERGIHWPEV